MRGWGRGGVVVSGLIALGYEGLYTPHHFCLHTIEQLPTEYLLLGYV
jgi:hypothetical protein